MLALCEWIQHDRWIINPNRSAFVRSPHEVLHYAGFLFLIGSIALVELRVPRIVRRGRSGKALAPRGDRQSSGSPIV